MAPRGAPLPTTPEPPAATAPDTRTRDNLRSRDREVR